MEDWRAPECFLRCMEHVEGVWRGRGRSGGRGTRFSFFLAVTVHFEARYGALRSTRVALSPSLARALHPPVSMEPWSPAWINHQLGLPADWWPPAGEFDAYEAKAIDLLRTSGTKSGFLEVYASGERWQAKPYVSPGTQRHLGSFSSAREAARKILYWRLGIEQLPPSPKPRNKRGAGRKPRSRSQTKLVQHAKRVAHKHVEPCIRAMVLDVSSSVPADSIVVPCCAVRCA